MATATATAENDEFCVTVGPVPVLTESAIRPSWATLYASIASLIAFHPRQLKGLTEDALPRNGAESSFSLCSVVSTLHASVELLVGLGVVVVVVVGIEVIILKEFV